MIDYTKPLLLDRTVYLTDVAPLVNLMNAADRIIATDKRGELNDLGYRGFSIETMNAVELIRKAMTELIHELHAKTMPKP